MLYFDWRFLYLTRTVPLLRYMLSTINCLSSNLLKKLLRVEICQNHLSKSTEMTETTKLEQSVNYSDLLSLKINFSQNLLKKDQTITVAVSQIDEMTNVLCD